MHVKREFRNTLENEEQYISSGFHSFYELFFAVLITALLVWAGYYLVNPATLPIRQVRIEGEFRHLSTSALQELVQNKVRSGFFNVDVDAVREAVLTEPWVRHVSVHRVWPDSLQVFVTEQTAAARWNDVGLLNIAGGLFTPAKSTFPADLPLLEGPEGTEKAVMSRYLSLRESLQPFDIGIARLNLDDRRAWSFRLDNGLDVIVGRNDFDTRITRFVEMVLTRLGSKLDKAALIDLRYPNGFAVRWTKRNPEKSG